MGGKAYQLVIRGDTIVVIDPARPHRRSLPARTLPPTQPRWLEVTRFVLPFCFKNENGTRTSHHLIFVTKHFRGYEIMKDIMANRSTGSCQGVPSFEYCEADKNQPTLFELSRPLDDLENLLLPEFHVNIK